MRVAVYVTRRCVYCRRAEALLAKRRVPFERIDVSEDAAERRRLVGVTGRRTVPQIFIDGWPIGGFRELAAMDRSGELAAILAAPP